jgi:hypothetical protein
VNGPEEQVQFITTFVKEMAEAVVKEIRNGQIPDTWNGFELRWYLADAFTSESKSTCGERRGSAYKSYCNDKIINNLRY